MQYNRFAGEVSKRKDFGLYTDTSSLMQSIIGKITVIIIQVKDDQYIIIFLTSCSCSFVNGIPSFPPPNQYPMVYAIVTRRQVCRGYATDEHQLNCPLPTRTARGHTQHKWFHPLDACIACWVVCRQFWNVINFVQTNQKGSQQVKALGCVCPAGCVGG